jgi:hypothetical protein
VTLIAASAAGALWVFRRQRIRKSFADRKEYQAWLARPRPWKSTVEPDNEAVRRALAAAEERRSRAAADWHDATPDEMTVPSTIADEHETNPFLRAANALELGQRRAAKDSF